MIYTFSQAEAEHAYRTWNANCGPNALAFALQMPLEAVRRHIPRFEERHYTSPSMMKAALASLCRSYISVKKPTASDMFDRPPALVRVQWGGPWIVNGKPQRWAARQTHWVCAWEEEGRYLVFDVNGGMQLLEDWRDKIVPLLTSEVPRCDGTWYPANVWRLA
jgi:hypothetical protein